MKTISRESRIMSNIVSVFIMAEECRWTASRLTESMHKRVYAQLGERTPGGRNRYTASERGFASGVECAMRNAIWREKVEFCYRDKNGVLFSTLKGSTHRSTEEFYAAGKGVDLCDMECAHVWRGTDKPFTEWSIPNKRKPVDHSSNEQAVDQ